MQNINVAILGFGLSGSTFHAPLISNTEGLNLTHIQSRQRDKVISHYPNVMVVDSLNEILNLNSVDLVINTLPNSEHYSVTRQCLLAGKHVVVEKPFVISSSEGSELIELANSKNLMLSVYHNRRWDNSFLTLKQQLPNLGRIYNYETYYDRFRPTVNLSKWREQDAPGSGILYDLGSHLIDQAVQLFGVPNSLIADIDIQRKDARAVDYFQVTFQYERMRVIIGSASVMTQPRPILAAYGDKGSYVKYGLDTQEDTLKNGGLPTQVGYGVEDTANSGILSLAKNNTVTSKPVVSLAGAYQQYYAQVQACIAQGAKNPVSAESALVVIKLIELAIQSYAQKKLLTVNI